MKLHLTAKIKRLGTIGPHEGKELELMLSGKKPAAIVNAFELQFFEPYVEDKTLVSVGSIPDRNLYVFTLPGEERRGKKILDLIKDGPPKPNKPPSEYEKHYHTELGRLLGYSEKEIEDFFKNLTTEEVGLGT